jgi:hypothetical protein
MAYDKKKYSNIDLSKYDKGYQASSDVIAAQKAKEQAENAVKNYGSFNYANQGAYDSAMDAILNRKPFSYDLNGDALYQQYKDNYMNMGKLAMQDTMGQAAALTGGYGNSYAASAGNQAYQGYLQGLNNLVPELYNLALSAYNSEGDRLNNNFNLLATDRNTQYGEWSDGYNRLVSERGYAADNYNNAYTQDYSKWSDNRNYDTTQYWNETNMGYQQERDAIADAQWQKEYNLAVSSAYGGSGSGSKTTYAIDDVSDLNDNIWAIIDNAALTGYDEPDGAIGRFFNSPEKWIERNPQRAYDNVKTTLGAMIDNGEMSPAVAGYVLDVYEEKYGVSPTGKNRNGSQHGGNNGTSSK